MPKSTHTPGPWRVEPDKASIACDAMPPPRYIAQTDGRSLIECYANARLIAAAPEMLEELRFILRSLGANELVDGDGCNGSGELFQNSIRALINRIEAGQ